MEYKTETNYKEEILEWESYIPKDADKLIIGTFPTAIEKRSFEFFYPNKDNPFWEVLSIIADMKLKPANDFEAVKNRKLILSKLNLGITDMGNKILRLENSSLDQKIFPLEFMNIFRILDENPKIQKLILTSSSGGNSVESWLKSYCKINSVDFPNLKGKNPKYGKLKYKNKEIDVVTVHSTSKAARKTVDELVDMYTAEIIGIY